MKSLALVSSVLVGITLATGAHALDVDPQLPAYKPVPVGSAEIKFVGSDTLGDLMRNWADEFAKLNPNVKIEVESKGSSTAPRALVDGVSRLGRCRVRCEAKSTSLSRKNTATILPRFR
jgi:phosphate transport system substrate-binding protein